MNILMAHNHYQQPGGEDTSFASERSLLESHGHHVVSYTIHNDSIAEMSGAEVALATFWNRKSYGEFDRLFGQSCFDIAHFQNTFPLISPAAYYAAHKHGVPVVQSLRNYRLLCANSFLLREGKVCEKCMHTWIPWPGVWHACYRESRPASAVVAGMLAYHRLLGTWRDKVDGYIALTEFSRLKFIEGGLPAHKIYVKPNFLDPDPGARESEGEYALFVGRLSSEKGLATLLEAWARLGPIPLKIVGSGPMSAWMADFLRAQKLAHVELLGQVDSGRVLQLLKQARCLVFPSEWYEGFPRTILEAFACGVPVVASNLGSMSELIVHRETGLHFGAGDADDLAAQVDALWSDPLLQTRLSAGGRAEYQAKYTRTQNYEQTLAIYEQVRATARRI